MHLARGQLLRLQALLIPSAAGRLATLALSHGVFLCFFELAAIHVLRCIGRPRSVWTLILVWVAPIISSFALSRPAFLFVGNALLSLTVLFIVLAG